MLNVVYINTTGNRSGALVSLLEIVRNLRTKVRATLLTPVGSASAFAEKEIGKVHTVWWLSQFDHTRYGRYKGVRWLIAFREVVLLPITLVQILIFSRRVGKIDLIHLNEITGILPAVALSLLTGAPLVAHIRANMGAQERGLRSRFLWYLVRTFVSQVICIDESVRDTVPATIGAVVIHNTLDVRRFRADSSAANKAIFAKESVDVVNVGLVGSVIRVKGVFEFVKAAINISAIRHDVKFFVVGSGVRRLGRILAFVYRKLRLTEDAEHMIELQIARSNCADRIVMTGHLDDLRAVYDGLDVLCFPSHYDAPGRPIFEAAYFGKPSIVAIERPKPDTFVDGVTGLVVKAGDVMSLQVAILKLVDDREMRVRMGTAALQLALVEFDPKLNADKVFSVYLSVLGRPATG